MTKLETLYASIKGLQDLGLPLNEETLKAADELEEQLIKTEILPAMSKDIEPMLSQIQRELVLVIEYKPGTPISVALSRKPNIAELLDAKKLEVSNEEAAPSAIHKEHSSHGPALKLEVRLNGKVVAGKDGASVLTEAIRLIGYERVASLDIRFVNGEYNLVDRRNRKDQNRRWQHKSGSWYIYTSTANTTKAENLAEIASRLGLDMQIYLEGEQFYPSI